MTTQTALTTEKIMQTVTIDAPMAHLWSMLSNRDDLCDWLCYDAHVHFSADDGFATFIWVRNERHVYGTYNAIEEHKLVDMSWHDGSEWVTRVVFKLEETDAGITVTLKHKGFTDSDHKASYESFWETHLGDLKSILETGSRPSITDRVLVGVIVDSSYEGEGTRIARSVDGYSAANAGITAGDIILGVDGKSVNDARNIHSIIGDKKPGDSVPLTYLRGDEEKTVDVELKGHFVPEIPANFDEMADQHRAEYERVNVALKDALDSVSAEDAKHKPADDQLSIREMVARIVLQQRHTLEWLSTYANGPRRINGYAHEQERIDAILAVYGTTDALVSLLERTQDETIGMINAFDKRLQERKGHLWWMTFEIWWTEDLAMQNITYIRNLRDSVAA
ncbi:MAG: PDZ domain-containing protein [Chloroflexota bacterium]